MYNLLFVDDEPIVKITIQKMICWDDSEFNLSGTANSGISALEYYKRYGADAVITDLQMPGMDGVTLISRLRNEGFNGPILALSNYSDFELVRGALTAGAFDYLLKVNLNSENLMDILKRMKSLIEQSNRKATEDQNKDMLIEAQNKNLGISELRNYILSGTDQDAEPVFTHLPFDSIFPATVCTIHIDKSTIAGEESVQFLDAVANEVFEDVSRKFIIRIHHNELLCLINQKDLEARNRNMEGKLSRIKKQINVLSSLDPAIMYVTDARSISDIMHSYSLCNNNREALYADLSASPLLLAADIPSQRQASSKKRYRREVNDVIRYMEKNFSSKITLEDIATHVNLSKEYLCRLFKSETGTSLFQYLENIRMQKAAELILADPSVMIKEVSMAIGIDNPLFFSKKFKTFFGVSPTQYYNSIQKQQESNS